MQHLGRDPVGNYQPQGDLESEMKGLPMAATALQALRRMEVNILQRPETQALMKKREITPREARALIIYTLEDGGKVYESLNAALHQFFCDQNDAVIIPWRGYLYYLRECLKKLLPYKGPVFRGMGLPEAVVKKYREHSDVFWSGFTSTSTNEKIALDFAFRSCRGDAGKVPVLFRIGCQYGKLIDAFSAYPQEGEVMLSLNSAHFVMADSQHREIEGNKVFVIDMVEKVDGRPYRW
jgi:hypothetical protein